MAGGGAKLCCRGGSVRAWRRPFLSPGELSLEAKMLETGGRVRAGQEMRLLDIPADAGADMGVFDDIGDFDAPLACGEPDLAGAVPGVRVLS
jgi:hypothetical protein